MYLLYLFSLCKPSYTRTQEYKKKQGPISPTTVRHKAQCVMSGSVTHFFFFLEWKNSALWLLLSLLLLPPLPTCTVYITGLRATSSCVFSRGRQVEFWEIWEIIARGQDETRWAVAKWLQAESRSPPKCPCVLLLHVRRAGDYLFSVLWCLAVCTAWKELPESEANDWVPNEYLICGIRQILTTKIQLLKLTWLHLSEALLLLWPMYIKVLKIVRLHTVVLKISPTPLIIHCTVGKNRIFTFLIGFWQSVASLQGHGFDSQASVCNVLPASVCMGALQVRRLLTMSGCLSLCGPVMNWWLVRGCNSAFAPRPRAQEKRWWKWKNDFDHIL